MAPKMDWKNLLNPERRRKSSLSSDHRAEFERDYDRSIFSTPVKRLQDKAQVFPLEPIDAIRTRLTHSLEVSSVARGIAARVAVWLHSEREIELQHIREIEAIAATCGLIHDLGNPPFGHAGEDAIREWFVDHFQKNQKSLDPQLEQDFRSFEGNAQTLRIVSKLQILADFHGLNYTFGTLSASFKYVAASHQVVKGNQAYKKPGYFASERDVVETVRAACGTIDVRNPITFLVEAADDIVYSAADIEDAVKKGVITWQRLNDIFKGWLDTDSSHPVGRALEIKNRILGDDVNRSFTDDVHAAAFRTGAISVGVLGAFDSFKENYLAIMSGTHLTELVAHSSITKLVEGLKKIGQDLVYPNKSTIKLELMGRRVINDLMTLFWEGAEVLPVDSAPKTKSFEGRIGALLSQNYRDVFMHSVKTGGLPELYYRYQLVTDYVCGMTDTFACSLHRELFDAE